MKVGIEIIYACVSWINMVMRKMQLCCPCQNPECWICFTVQNAERKLCRFELNFLFTMYIYNIFSTSMNKKADCMLLLSGCRPQAQHMEHQPCPKSPVFRTGSEPALSPTVPRRLAFDTQPGEAIRGSDSQLCPKPPPKPSKVPSMRVSCTPGLKILSPPVPPVKPHKQRRSSQQQSGSPLSPELNYCERSPCSPADWEKMTSYQANGYVERLKSEEELRRCDSSVTLDRSSYHNAIEALDNDSEEDNKEEVVDKGQICKKGFKRPVFETESAFKPGDICFRLLPAENKPLEMTVLKKAKELFVSQDPKTIAKHILQADCQVIHITSLSNQHKINSYLFFSIYQHALDIRNWQWTTSNLGSC